MSRPEDLRGTGEPNHGETDAGRNSDILDARFPARAVLAIVSNKWVPAVLYCLSVQEVRRFNELQRQIPDISKKMLIQTLRNLERDGLVHRTVYQQVPPKTEYRLTDDGRRLREPIAQLCRWAAENRSILATILSRRGTNHQPNQTSA